MSSENTIAKAAFARELGVTKARVSQLVKQGLPVRKDGKLNRVTAHQWHQMNVARRVNIRSRSSGEKSSGAGSRDSKKAKEASSSDRPGKTATERYRLARAEHEEVKAAKSMFELRQLASQLVCKEDMERSTFEAFRAVRAVFQSVPGRLAAQIAEMDDPKEVHALLTSEIREALLSIGRDRPATVSDSLCAPS